MVWHVVKEYAKNDWEFSNSLRTISGDRVPDFAMIREENWSRSNSCSAMSPCKQRKNTWDANRGFGKP